MEPPAVFPTPPLTTSSSTTAAPPAADHRRTQGDELLRAIATRLVALAGRVDRTGRLTQLEGPLLEKLRVRPAFYLGRDALAMYPDAAPALRRALAGEPAYLDWAVSVDGAARQMEVCLLPNDDPSGGAMFFLRDVSERRRLEREVLEISDSEQRRLGQDLHDGLGQHLAGIAYLSAILHQQLADVRSPEADGAAQITTLVHEAIEQTRALARNLCPVDLQSHNLRRALRSLAAGVTATYGVRCELAAGTKGEGDVRDGENEGEELSLPGGAQAATHLYRIAQEAVGNAIRHGRARHVRVQLGRNEAKEGGGILCVHDDGTGFDERRAADHARRHQEGGGLGLHMMRYRAHHLGGTLSVRPAGDSGTSVCCTFPLTEPTALPRFPGTASEVAPVFV